MSPRSRIFKCSGHHHPPVYIRLHSLCSFKKTPTFFYLQHQKMIISPEKPCFTYKTSQKILKSYKKIKCDCNLFWKINIKCFGVKFMKWFLKKHTNKILQEVMHCFHSPTDSQCLLFPRWWIKVTLKSLITLPDKSTACKMASLWR